MWNQWIKTESSSKKPVEQEEIKNFKINLHLDGNGIGIVWAWDTQTHSNGIPTMDNYFRIHILSHNGERGKKRKHLFLPIWIITHAGNEKKRVRRRNDIELLGDTRAKLNNLHVFFIPKTSVCFVVAKLLLVIIINNITYTFNENFIWTHTNTLKCMTNSMGTSSTALWYQCDEKRDFGASITTGQKCGGVGEKLEETAKKRRDQEEGKRVHSNQQQIANHSHSICNQFILALNSISITFFTPSTRVAYK